MFNYELLDAALEEGQAAAAIERFRAWLDDDRLLVSTQAGERVARIDGEKLAPRAFVAPGVPSVETVPDPGSDLIFRRGGDAWDYGVLDPKSGKYRKLGNLADDEGFQEPNVYWAPTGHLAVVLSEEVDPA